MRADARSAGSADSPSADDMKGIMDSMEKVQYGGSFLLAPVPVVLVGCAHKELGKNLITIAWTGVDCSDPMILHVSIRPSRYS